MAITKSVTLQMTFTCDKCGAAHTGEVQVTPTRDGRVPPNVPQPDGWAQIGINGLPMPAEHRMARTLQGAGDAVSDLLDDWDDGTDAPVLPSAKNPLGIPEGAVQRLLCTECIGNVWDAVGKPPMPGTITSYGDQTTPMPPKRLRGVAAAKAKPANHTRPPWAHRDEED